NNLFLETDGTQTQTRSYLDKSLTFLRVYYWRSVKSSSNCLILKITVPSASELGKPVLASKKNGELQPRESALEDKEDDDDNTNLIDVSKGSYLISKFIESVVGL
ncbi:42744_t:CDS:2, partial [Gigaspora margarita]